MTRDHGPGATADPFARLMHTHRRIEERLDDLLDATTKLEAQPTNLDAFEAIERVLGFFDRAGRRHHDDEERSLFPRLPKSEPFASIVVALEAEHRAHTEATNRLEGLVQSVGNGTPTPDHVMALRQAALSLRTLYLAHIDREERELFPLCRDALDGAAQVAIAEEFEGRRPHDRH